MGELKTAVIMAGGQGTRLSKITGPLPKAMVNIRNTSMENFGKAKDTILEHQMNMLSENGITNFILVVGNKKEYIQAAFTNEIINHNIPGRNITIRYFAEDRPLGTAGAFCSRELQDMIQEDDFLFTYADVLFDVNIGKMYAHTTVAGGSSVVPHSFIPFNNTPDLAIINFKYPNVGGEGALFDFIFYDILGDQHSFKLTQKSTQKAFQEQKNLD